MTIERLKRISSLLTPSHLLVQAVTKRSGGKAAEGPIEAVSG